MRATLLALSLLVVGCHADPAEYLGELGGVGFALRLPPGSSVVSDQTYPEMRQRRWESPARMVVVVELHERDPPDPCLGPNPSAGRGAEVVDGVEIPADFSFNHCLAEGARHLRCASWHRRGHLEGDEVALARDTCASMRVLP